MKPDDLGLMFALVVEGYSVTLAPCEYLGKNLTRLTIVGTGTDTTIFDSPIPQSKVSEALALTCAIIFPGYNNTPTPHGGGE